MAYVPQDTFGSSFRPKSSTIPSTQVELRIACRNLLDLDLTSKSDPMCVIYCKDPYSDRYIEVGRTEVIKNTLNPDFVKAIPITYSFEEHQKLRFDVYDFDIYHGHSGLAGHDYLGRMECSLGEIVSRQGQFKRQLTHVRYSTATILVTAEEVGGSKEILVMQFSGTGLDKKDVFGKSDPFLTFSKINEDSSLTVVHKSEVVMNTLNPSWRPMKIPLRNLCNGDLDRTIVVHCYDWDSDGGHDLIGEFKTNARSLMKGSRSLDNVYECINPKKKAKKRNYKNSGIVKLMSFKVELLHSFLDYIQGGTQLHFTVAVDFTASNGDPREPTSLHYQNPSYPNAYTIAIRSVGEIIADYDNDKMFPALGFGARLPPNWRVSHEFFLNGSPNSPYCFGVDGILAAYMQALQTVQLYGPTNFSPVINHVARFASTVRDGSAYFVLLIITDGVISDMLETKRAIVNASTLPMSIIIVGVGFADFRDMEELDGDTMGLSADGRYALRDVVQFVAMKDFLNPNVPWEHRQARLAKEVMAEIPNQVVSYMTKNSIVPRASESQPGYATAPPDAASTFAPS